MIEDRQRPRYWLITTGLAGAVVATAALGALVLPLFVPEMNRNAILGFPLGFYLVAQGLVLVLIAVVSWLGGRQSQVDQQYGAIEDV